MSAITIVQLYPGELGVAGDSGNVMAVARRLENAGLASVVVEHVVGDALPARPDLVIVGNGPLSAMRNVHDDLLAVGPRLRELVQSGMPVFAYGSGAEMLGRDIRLLDGTVMEGAGVFPLSTERVEFRKVGYVVTESSPGTLVGFEDNASYWHLDEDAGAFGTVLEGGGNGEGRREGVRVRNSIGTQVGGPVLPLNPGLTDELIRVMAERGPFSYEPGAANDRLDDYASRAREVILANTKHVFSRI